MRPRQRPTAKAKRQILLISLKPPDPAIPETNVLKHANQFPFSLSHFEQDSLSLIKSLNETVPLPAHFTRPLKRLPCGPITYKLKSFT